MWRRGLLALALLLPASCGPSSVVNPVDASRAPREASLPDTPAGDATSRLSDVPLSDAHPPDSRPPGDASSEATSLADMGGSPDTARAADAPSPSADMAPADACGICDRNWLCNVADDYWMSEGGDCVDTRTGTTLRCDGTIGGGGGTWAVTSTGLALYFNSLCGGTNEIDCTPG